MWYRFSAHSRVPKPTELVIPRTIVSPHRRRSRRAHICAACAREVFREQERERKRESVKISSVNGEI